MVSTLSPLLAGGRTTIAGRFNVKTFFERRREKPGDVLFSGADDLRDAVRITRRHDPRYVLGAVRGVRCGACQRRIARHVRSPLRHPDCRGVRTVRGHVRQRTQSVHGKRKAGTVGLPMPGQAIRVVDPRATRASRRGGEVVISGPNVMRGYLNRPEETAKTIVNGWLHTGDIGRLDEDGYLALVDRAKDMIIRGGENIYPNEIEAVMYQLSQIAEVAVVGRPDPVLGEEPVAFVCFAGVSALRRRTARASGRKVGEVQAAGDDLIAARASEEPRRQDRQAGTAQTRRHCLPLGLTTTPNPKQELLPWDSPNPISPHSTRRSSCASRSGSACAS